MKTWLIVTEATHSKKMKKVNMERVALTTGIFCHHLHYHHHLPLCTYLLLLSPESPPLHTCLHTPPHMGGGSSSWISLLPTPGMPYLCTHTISNYHHFLFCTCTPCITLLLCSTFRQHSHTHFSSLTLHLIFLGSSFCSLLSLHSSCLCTRLFLCCACCLFPVPSAFLSLSFLHCTAVLHLPTFLHLVWVFYLHVSCTSSYFRGGGGRLPTIGSPHRILPPAPACVFFSCTDFNSPWFILFYLPPTTTWVSFPCTPTYHDFLHHLHHIALHHHTVLHCTVSPPPPTTTLSCLLPPLCCTLSTLLPASPALHLVPCLLTLHTGLPGAVLLFSTTHYLHY